MGKTLNKVVKNFKAYYLSSELADASWTLEDAWLEYCNIKPEETDSFKLTTIRRSADAENWYDLRNQARTKFQNRFRDSVREKAKEVNQDVIKALSEKVSNEIALLDKVVVELMSKFDLDSMSFEERLKLLDILLKHSSKISDNFVKMFTNKEGLPPMFSKMLGQAPHITVPVTGGELVPPTQSIDNIYEQLDVELGIIKNVIDGKPVSKVPPPDKKNFKAIEASARRVPAKMAEDEDEGFEGGDDDDE